MTPKKIALLTDSSADLRWDQARENNIFFVPLRILCEDGEYLDGVNITGPDIYQRLHNGELPQTSLPRVEDFSAKLREIFDLGYDGVIAVMLSSGLSGTYNLARILAGECAEQGYAMKVFDSVSGALGQGMTVLQLAEDIKNGMDWEELTERRAPQLIANTYPFFSVDTLEYLVKGGRIGKVTAMAGTMLQIKPIITFAQDGQLQSVAKVRGRQQVMRKLVEMTVSRCGSAGIASPRRSAPWRTRNITPSRATKVALPARGRWQTSIGISTTAWKTRSAWDPKSFPKRAAAAPSAFR